MRVLVDPEFFDHFGSPGNKPAADTPHPVIATGEYEGESVVSFARIIEGFATEFHAISVGSKFYKSIVG